MFPGRYFLFLLPTFALAAPESFPAENGLTRTLVAREPLLKNPISVTVDVDGTIYTTETTRRKYADLDIREFEQWVPNDLSFTSVEDKLAFYQKEITPNRFATHRSLKDHNKDGVVDLKDLTAFSEKVVQYQDKDGDGVMDSSTTFAENFNTEVTGIAAGVFAWRGDVFTTIAPDLWKLRDTDGDGKSDQREAIATGFGLHIAYAGHDMHGLTWGPDGRLYWSIGDKGTNVMSKEGKRWAAPHEGAVLRCFPDGTGFEIFARGLRNPQEIAFDEYGNLFSVDNDADMKGERERFVYITENSDSGWRCYYQYRKSNYNPWMAESMSVPTGLNQPAFITPPLASYSDGPSGFAYNPGTALNDRYKNSFFVTEFPKGKVQSFKVEPVGAAFKMTDAHTVISGPMNIGMNFGPDGALYLADWSGDYSLKEKGAIWKLDDPTQTGSALRKEVAEFLKTGPSKISTQDLTARLAHADQRVRLDAQWELAKRGANDSLIAVAGNPSSPQLTVIHALWGLSQTKTFAPELFEKLAKNPDAELRAQAAKWFGETGLAKSSAPLIALLRDKSSRVRYFAATAIGKHGLTGSLDSVIEMLAENNDEDAFLRQAGALALAGISEGVAEKTLKHPSAAVRLAAAVAFRRTGSAEVAGFLNDSDPRVLAEAARSIYDSPSIPAAFPELGKLIETHPTATVPAIRRSIAANRRLADTGSAVRLIAFANNRSVAEPLRVAALEALASWNQKIDLDLVDGRWDPIPAADPKPVRAEFEKTAAILRSDPSEVIAVAAAAAAKTFDIPETAGELIKQAANPALKPVARLRALDLLKSTDPENFKSAAIALLKSDSSVLRTGAASLLGKTESEKVITYLRDAISNSTDRLERQQAVEILVNLREEPVAKSTLDELFKKSLDSPDLPILLELLDAAEIVKTGPADALRQKITNSKNPKIASLEGGHASRGIKVFNEHLAAQCLACHRIGPEGSKVGPALTEIGKKGREYILESLIDPAAKIAPGFGVMTATLKDGATAAGALKTETANSLVLTLPDGTEQNIPVSQIASRTAPMTTMPPMGDILSPTELRDLVQYLTGLK